MSVGNNIRTLRESRRLTQKEFADALGVTKESVSRWESDKMAVRDRHIAKMMELFGVSKEDIVSPDYGLYAQASGRPRIEYSFINMESSNKESFAPLLGRVHACKAVEPEILDRDIPAPYQIMKNHKNAYFVEVEGTCMSKVYPEGCLVLIDPDKVPQSGSIAVVSIDGSDYIMRRVLIGANTLVLSPESYEDKWTDIVIDSKEHTVEMVGTVVWYQPRKELE